MADFDAAASDYDADTSGGTWLPNEHLAGLLAPLGLAPASLLDLGAGTGQTTEALLRLYPDAVPTLVDPSPGMLAVARRKLPGAEVVEADAATYLRSTTRSWDLVAAIGCLELVPDLLEVLRLAALRLGPDGHLAVSYEPLRASGVQSRPVSRLDRGRTVQRHAAAEVERRARSFGLERVASTEAVAFERGDGDGPAVYELVVWRRSVER